MQFQRWVLMFAIVAPQTTAQTDATARDLSIFRAVIEQKIPRRAPPAVDDKSPSQWLVVFDRTYPLCDAELKLWCMPSDTRDRGDAVVYVAYSCGGLCGEGWLIRLSKLVQAGESRTAFALGPVSAALTRPCSPRRLIGS